MKYVVICLTLTTASVSAADWTQFRGAGSAAVSTETGLPVKWSATENVRWKADLPGRGLSNPVIVGGKVFVTACSGYRHGRLHVLCLSEETGAKLWERQFTVTGPTMCFPTISMAAPSPTTDGTNVYALFATGDLMALDPDGNLLWYRSLNRDHGPLTNQLGLAASPVIAKNTLLLPMENVGNSFAAGIDIKTGQDRWLVARPHDINWVTPLVLNIDGRIDAAFATSKEITAYDPDTGKVRWTHAGVSPSPAASPTPAQNGLVIVPGAVVHALRPGPEGTTPELVWKTAKLSSGYTTPVAVGDRCYAVGRVAVNCVDLKTGESVWSQRIKGKTFWASPVAADGKLYVVSEEGTTSVLALGDKPEVLATNDIGETIMATPAVAGGCLYLRSDQHLFCIGKKK